MKKRKARHVLRHLGQPHHRSHLQAFQKNAMMQHRFLDAQNQMQARINEEARRAYAGNPRLELNDEVIETSTQL